MMVVDRHCSGGVCDEQRSRRKACMGNSKESRVKKTARKAALSTSTYIAQQARTSKQFPDCVQTVSRFGDSKIGGHACFKILGGNDNEMPRSGTSPEYIENVPDLIDR
eukprot:1993399-Rhodomonas_salina.1